MILERRTGGARGHSASAAFGADLRGGPRFAPGAAAGIALLDLLNAELTAAAEGRLLEVYVYGRADALSPGRSVGVARGIAAEAAETAEAASEQIVENVREASEALGAGLEAAGIESGKAELIVLGALVLVGEHLIGLIDFFEFRFAVLVSGMEVRMVFLGFFSVSLFDVVGTRVFVDAQHLVIVAFIRH